MTMEENMMMRTKTVDVWVPVFDYWLCAREFGFTVIGHPDKRRASLRRKVETLAKNAAATIVSECGVQVLETLDCGYLGYGSYPDSKNYLGVRVRAKVEIPEDVVACAESLKRLSSEALRERIQALYQAGDKHHAQRWDICATLVGDWFDDGYCISWSATHHQLCVQIRGMGRAYISRNEFLSLTRDDTHTQQERPSLLQRLKTLFHR
jgi:hypothetical protein